MKKQLAILSIFTFVFFTGSCKQNEPVVPPVIVKPHVITMPKLHSRTPAGILNYMDSLIINKKVLVGQHCNGWNNIAEAYSEHVVGLKTLSGKSPALIGLECGYVSNMNLTLNNQYAINFWNLGGLVTASWHADNPFKDEYLCGWNSVDKKDSIDLSKLIKSAPESKEKKSYRDELMRVGNALKQLKDAGVTVIWRPFHEMNGNWFWWGPNNAQNPTNVTAYKNLWKDMYDTFSKDLGLDNLIWVYAPNASATWASTIWAFYPGAEYVDMVGVDIYSSSPEFRDYTDLEVFKKTIVVSEMGPNSGSYGKYNESQIISQLKGKAAYFLQWSSWSGAKVSIKDNLNAVEMMNDTSAVTLDKILY